MSRLAGLLAKVLLAVAMTAFVIAIGLTLLAATLVSYPYRRLDPRAAKLAAGQRLLLAVLGFVNVARRGGE